MKLQDVLYPYLFLITDYLIEITKCKPKFTPSVYTKSHQFFFKYDVFTLD